MDSGPITMQRVRERLEGRVGGRAERDLAFRLPKTEVAFLAAEKRAAVAVGFGDSARGPEILLIRLAAHPDDPWSGHMAFPGGREDPGDPDLLSTAMRETLEELSLDLRSAARLLGSLDELPAVARGK